ncbi:MAG TPA: nitrous oxide reductase accessory protein NosL [Accumulibacter sp.]|uniref:nitrous oxide reductase accessory protein NosL n=1 Tax=Accumulibacter sp. TaxID=2053492 RepID=UPI000EE60763|nr:nitrous oxide reductase accessory protein NosL [Accumulibacter sp.]HCZ15368.1 protein NosL [Accumulibacter sp.]HRF73603.1 nitrous oxide reductase accessory protein NosL [Accumulibacter sp.]
MKRPINRRQFIAALPALSLAPCLGPLLGVGAGWSLAGCSGEPSSGPAQVKWDRDTDARCGMIISDKRFAAQIRDPDGKPWKFDDIGCAMFWLAQSSFNEETANTEYWVADYRTGGWIDARRAHYLPGSKSPMGYHFAALAMPEAGTVSYQEMKRTILARGK